MNWSVTLQNNTAHTCGMVDTIQENVEDVQYERIYQMTGESGYDVGQYTRTSNVNSQILAEFKLFLHKVQRKKGQGPCKGFAFLLFCFRDGFVSSYYAAMLAINASPAS
jgi:hypothetical protein